MRAYIAAMYLVQSWAGSSLIAVLVLAAEYILFLRNRETTFKFMQGFKHMLILSEHLRQGFRQGCKLVQGTFGCRTDLGIRV